MRGNGGEGIISFWVIVFPCVENEVQTKGGHPDIMRYTYINYIYIDSNARPKMRHRNMYRQLQTINLYIFFLTKAYL